MKYSLEDLLKQTYEKKETPSPDFCQAVIQNMKKKEKKFFFKQSEWVYHKRILAVICAEILILAGMGMKIFYQERGWNQQMPMNQEVAVQESHIPMETEDPIGIKNKVETENPAETQNKEEESAGTQNKVKSGEPTDPQSRVETEQSMENGNKQDAEHFFSNRIRGSRVQKPYSTDHSSVRHTPSEKNDSESNISDSGVDNQNPQNKETAKPKETVKPDKPSVSIPPQGNYIQLCSVENYSFKGEQEWLRPGAEELEYIYSSAFRCRLICSYEELQNLIEEIRMELKKKPNHDLQRILTHLEDYNPSYFDRYALCMDLSLLEARGDLKLSTVTFQDMGSGKNCLYVGLNYICNDTEQMLEKRYYISYISVPQVIVQNCDKVIFQYE